MSDRQESSWRAMIAPYMQECSADERTLVRMLFRLKMEQVRQQHPDSDRAFIRFIARSYVAQRCYRLRMKQLSR